MDDRSPQIAIVEMDGAHIERLAELEQLCFGEPWSVEGLLEELSNPTAVFRVALVDEEVAGYVGMHHVVDEGYITNIAVFPQYRRMGVGKNLMKALIRYAKDNEMSMITLEVRPSNNAARELYEGLGFSEEGLRKRFYRDPPEDGLIMTRFF